MDKQDLDKKKSADENGSSKKDFVEFKRRLTRLVEDLLRFRPEESLDKGKFSLTDAKESVEINIESNKVKVSFNTFEPLILEKVQKIVEKFYTKYSNYSLPLICYVGYDYLNFRTSENPPGHYLYYSEIKDIQLKLSKSLLGYYQVEFETSLKKFDDHFETLLTEIAPLLYPERKVIKESSKEKTKENLKIDPFELWLNSNYEYFTSLGCTIILERDFTWEHLKGLDYVKERLLKSIIEPLRRESLYKKIASRVLSTSVSLLPRGVLFYGPPGVGKTWSMKVVSGEAGIPVVIVPISAVLSKWFGESERILKSIFDRARKAGKIILMFDELDALARHREISHEASARIVSVLLSEMDGLTTKGDVLIVGAANNVELIDQAVLDRFDIKIEFRMPELDQLREVFKFYAKHLSDGDVEKILPYLKAWNFRQVSQFCTEVIRNFVSTLDLSQLEAPEPPLPRVEFYLEMIEKMRSLSVS